MSSDQQYPYDPERGYGTPPPQQPRYGTHRQDPAYGPQGAYEPHEPHGGAPDAAPDMEATQTWQGQTWDTGSQPTVGNAPAAPPSHQPSYHPYEEQHQRQSPYQGHQQYPEHQQPSRGGPAPAPYGSYEPGRPQTPSQATPPPSSMEETAFLAPVPGSGPAATPGPPASSMEETAFLAPVPASGPAATPGPPASSMEETAFLAPVRASGPAATPAPPASSSEETAFLGAPITAASGPGAAPAPAPAAAQPSGAYPLPPEVPPPEHGSGAQHGAGRQGAGAPPYPAPAEPTSPAPAPAAAPVPGPGPDQAGYNAPSTLGNARVTDAQRARAEGRSPIIPPGIQPAALTALLGLLLAGGAAVGSYALLVPVVVLQAVTATGWFRLNGMWPARQGIALAFLGGLVADVALLVAGRDNGPAAIMGTLGVWVLLTVVLQLRSHADPDTRLTGLLATVVSAALAIIATGYLASSSDAVVVGAVAVAVAALVRALPLPGPVSVAAALIVAAGAGLAMGAVTDFGARGALIGIGAGVCALVGLRAASYDYPSRFVHMTAGVALPLTAAAPVVYLLGRALG
ncbi:hypothetical protein [Streptomyces sp. 8L]|uniref:hypothetical protein n=1 Tax=Streptomyces sp. 8L TaxID=2877242 RepID=UPI001CD2529E|nr:hypothetical protein [Streptomyces sp. 8L]MCA1218334.1 hypothetical protein [Streptomyces sp. 8L]